VGHPATGLSSQGLQIPETGETLPQGDIGVRSKCAGQMCSGLLANLPEKNRRRLREDGFFHHRRFGADRTIHGYVQIVGRRQRPESSSGGLQYLIPKKKSNRCLTINPACMESAG